MVEPGARLDELVEKLRERGHRITPQRMAVLKILAANEEHPSVEQVYEHVWAEFPMTSLATVYKTVALLKEMGEVLELGFPNEGSHYDGNKPYPHPHLVCVKCGRIEDLEIPVLSELPQQVAQRTGYRIENHRLDFFGTCPQCQEAGDS